MYQQAAAQLKIAREYEKAGDVYAMVADLCLNQIKNKPDTIANFNEAGKAYKQAGKTDQAIKMFKNAANMQRAENRISAAAKLFDEIGQLYAGAGQRKEAIDAYKTAAQCYESDNGKVTSQLIYVKAADLLVDEDDLKGAIDIYEKVAADQSTNVAMSFSAKPLYFKALLCHFALEATKGAVTAKTTAAKLLEYGNSAPRFEGSKEQELVGKLVTAYESNDVSGFENDLRSYNAIYRLDNLSVALLIKVKDTMTKAPSADDVVRGLEGGGEFNLS